MTTMYTGYVHVRTYNCEQYNNMHKHRYIVIVVHMLSHATCELGAVLLGVVLGVGAC